MKIVHLNSTGRVGNCLFRSCGYHLGIDHVELRRQVVEIIRNSSHLSIEGTPLSEWIRHAGHNPSTYADYMARDGVYGTGVELAIISILYRRTIRVMNAKFCPKNRCPPRFTQISEYFPNFGHPFYLLFSGSPNGGHYEPLE